MKQAVIVFMEFSLLSASYPAQLATRFDR